MRNHVPTTSVTITRTETHPNGDVRPSSSSSSSLASPASVSFSSPAPPVIGRILHVLRGADHVDFVISGPLRGHPELHAVLTSLSRGRPLGSGASGPHLHP